MPYSSVVGKEWTRAMLSKLRDLPQSPQIVDIGPGSGTYYDLLSDLFPDSEWLGVEVWAPYIEQFGLDKKYNEVIVGDARYVDLSRLVEPGAIILLGDVLEHMPKDDAAQLVHDLWYDASYMVISVPLGDYPQGAEGGNKWETHVQTYEPGEIPALLSGIIVHSREMEGIGVYIVTGAMA